MHTDKKEIAFGSDCADFFGSDEYELVSSVCHLSLDPVKFISFANLARGVFYQFIGDDILLMSEELQPKQNEVTYNSFYNQLFSSIKQYKDEWDELYNNEELDLHKLQKISTEGQLRTSRFRSVCWRCLLGILHKQPQQWLCQLKMYRKYYDEICKELEQNPWNVKENNPYDNPLSQESDSIWQKYFYDEELKAAVHQDVKRTFPGMEFFMREDIQAVMVRILFCYARQNPALCYRQGMHEILAPLIFILHCDQQAFLHAREQIPNLGDDIGEILNPVYLEQDAYSIFKYVMNHIECSYRLNNLMTGSVGTPVDTLKYESNTCQNEVLSRLDYIKKNLLQPRDPELNEHLQKLDIPLHLFGIRWLRLLFGREFPLQDLLVLWDFIFSNNFETVNFIVVAMLVGIRQILLNGDYTDCLSNLMRYPAGVDVSFIINYALHLKDPQKHMSPDISRSFYHSSVIKSKPTSESVHTQSQLNRRLKKGLSRPTRWFYEKPNMLVGDGDGSIVSGYAANDPNLIKAELEQTKAILNVVHHNLVQFHSTLVENLPRSVCADVQGALDGIFKLSCLLKAYNSEVNCEIETACEAGETKDLRTHKPQQKKPKSSELSINNDNKSHTLPKMKKGPKSGELKVFKHHIGGAIKGLPMIDPLHLIKNIVLDDCLDTLSK